LNKQTFRDSMAIMQAESKCSKERESNESHRWLYRKRFVD
jgi:hypothetical protein